jgi:hypothetical protein
MREVQGRSRRHHTDETRGAAGGRGRGVYHTRGVCLSNPEGVFGGGRRGRGGGGGAAARAARKKGAKAKGARFF